MENENGTCFVTYGVNDKWVKIIIFYGKSRFHYIWFFESERDLYLQGDNYLIMWQIWVIKLINLKNGKIKIFLLFMP